MAPIWPRPGVKKRDLLQEMTDALVYPASIPVGCALMDFRAFGPYRLVGLAAQSHFRFSKSRSDLLAHLSFLGTLGEISYQKSFIVFGS